MLSPGVSRVNSRWPELEKERPGILIHETIVFAALTLLARNKDLNEAVAYVREHNSIGNREEAADFFKELGKAYLGIESDEKPFMQVDVYYDLIPPKDVNGSVFSRVRCLGQVPDRPGHFRVSGIPYFPSRQNQMGNSEEWFIFVPGASGQTTEIRLSEDQS